MRTHSHRSAVLIMGMLTLVGVGLAACGSSKSSTNTPTSGARTPAATSAPAGSIVSGTPAASDATTAATAGSSTTTGSSTGTLPTDACTLMTEQEASKLAGAPVTAHTLPPLPGPGGKVTAQCEYYGSNGKLDHAVGLSVQSFADAGAAQKLMQQQSSQVQQLKFGFKSIGGTGDEAFEVQIGPASRVEARTGSLILSLNAGGVSYAAPPLSALEAELKTALGRLQQGAG